jgi:transcription initiation factor TFIIIB Brf1 subunit/transcription initiation factor TFIIB
MAAVAAFREDDENICCRSCRLATLIVDWAQGDRICTYCGVVNDERLLDDRPEWRDYNDAGDEVAKDKARCGLVHVDETRYFGGLQPTGLSKYIHGAPYKSSATTRKTLVRINRKMDHSMELIHAKAVQDARLVRAIAAKGRETESTDCDDIRPEIEQLLLHEEDDANRLQIALNANKWSLSRALRLYGSEQEQAETRSNDDNSFEADEMLDTKLDQKLRQCARDLYQAYTMLTLATRKLKLPDRVTGEAVKLLCEYASRRDGIVVRGVSSTLQLKRTVTPTKSCDKQHDRATSALREYNKFKQAGALVAAILLYTGRRHCHERSMQEICASIEPPILDTGTLDTSGEFIKKKHCSKAMKEVELFFPKAVVQSASTVTSPLSLMKNSHLDGSASISNYTDHVIRELSLPPVAEASVRLLCLYWHQKGQADVKLSTICASMTYFVCCAGTTMKRLASQATKSKKRKLSGSFYKSDRSPALVERKPENFESMATGTGDHSDVAKEQRAYEMMRVWDAWQEQMAWSKSVSEIEQCCGISSTVLLEYYRQHLHPCRLELLCVLKESVEGSSADSNSLRSTPLATVLLPQIAVAAPLLSADGVQ